MPGIKSRPGPPRRLTRPTRVESSESEDDEMGRFRLGPEDEWEVPNTPNDLYGVSDNDDDDDDDPGWAERRGGMGFGSGSNRGVGGPAAGEAVADASDQGSSGPRAPPQRNVLPSVEESGRTTWKPLPSYNVDVPAHRGAPRPSHTASSLSAGRQSSSISRSPQPLKKRRIGPKERDGNGEDADPYPTAPLLGDSSSGVGAWANPPGVEPPPIPAADSAQYPAVNSAPPPSPAAHVVIDPSLAGPPTSTPADGVVDPSLAGSASALPQTGLPFAPSVTGSDFATNLPGHASGSAPAVVTAQPAPASSVPVDSNHGPSSASTGPQAAITQDPVSISAAGANNASANSVSTEEIPSLRRSGRVWKAASAPVEKAVEPAKAKKAVRAASKPRIEIKRNRLREDDGLKHNAFDFFYRKTDREDAPWTWEAEDELWKTYRSEILNYWGDGRRRRLAKLVGGVGNISPFFLARIYKHRINNSPEVEHLAHNDVRKQEYQWGWVGYKDLFWWTWDQLGHEHDDVRQYYLEQNPDLVDYGPVAEDE